MHRDLDPYANHHAQVSEAAVLMSNYYLSKNI
jgi:hypothetical protein